MRLDRPLTLRHRVGAGHGGRVAAVAVLAFAALLFAGSPARASLVFEILGSTTTPAGGTGSFDIVLDDQDLAGSTTVSAFSAELSVVSSSGVKFTSVTGATTAAGYIFGTVQSPPLSLDAFPNTTFTAADTDVTAPGYVTLNPGTKVGLAHVSYSVAPGTPIGPVTISFVSAGDSLSDKNGAALAFTTSNGTITVTAAAIPEPSPLVLGTIGGGLALLAGRLRRKR